MSLETWFEEACHHPSHRECIAGLFHALQCQSMFRPYDAQVLLSGQDWSRPSPQYFWTGSKECTIPLTHEQIKQWSIVDKKKKPTHLHITLCRFQDGVSAEASRPLFVSTPQNQIIDPRRKSRLLNNVSFVRHLSKTYVFSCCASNPSSSLFPALIEVKLETQYISLQAQFQAQQKQYDPLVDKHQGLLKTQKHQLTLLQQQEELLNRRQLNLKRKERELECELKRCQTDQDAYVIKRRNITQSFTLSVQASQMLLSYQEQKLKRSKALARLEIFYQMWWQSSHLKDAYPLVIAWEEDFNPIPHARHWQGFVASKDDMCEPSEIWATFRQLHSTARLIRFFAHKDEEEEQEWKPAQSSAWLSIHQMLCFIK